MNLRHPFLTSSVFVALTAFSSMYASAAPDPVPDPGAKVAYLRTSCEIVNSDPGETPLENCFESMGALHTWIYAGRTNIYEPLLIEMGPGVFGIGVYGYECTGGTGGNLTFRGAGSDKTQINGSFFGLRHIGCTDTNWSFENLEVKGGAYAVLWDGSGASTWTNSVIANGWYDELSGGFNVCPAGEQGLHRFFSSRILEPGNGTAYFSACAESWFWGSEIHSTSGIGINVVGEGNSVHLYGSNIRVEAGPSTTSNPVKAISVSDGGEVHAHGVGIDVIGNPGGTRVLVALDADTGASIHANQSSFVVQPSVGVTYKRIDDHGGNGHVHAPYLWEHLPTPTTFISNDGADMAPVTTNTSDGHPHIVIYSSACASKWYDTTDKVCRP